MYTIFHSLIDVHCAMVERPHMRVITWAFLATLSLVLMVQLRGLDSDLRLPDVPNGIVSYELAWSDTRAATVIDAWRSAGVIEQAKVSLGVDFAFLLAYPFMFSVGAALLVRTTTAARFDRIGQTLSRAVLCCIPLDATENIVLWRMLDAGASSLLAHIGTICAVIKFALVLMTAIWCAAAIGRRVMLSGKPHTSG